LTSLLIELIDPQKSDQTAQAGVIALFTTVAQAEGRSSHFRQNLHWDVPRSRTKTRTHPDLTEILFDVVPDAMVRKGLMVKRSSTFVILRVPSLSSRPWLCVLASS